MPPEDELSPEERLLKVIQQGHKAETAGPQGRAKPVEAQKAAAEALPPPAPAVSEVPSPPRPVAAPSVEAAPAAQAGPARRPIPAPEPAAVKPAKKVPEAVPAIPKEAAPAVKARVAVKAAAQAAPVKTAEAVEAKKPVPAAAGAPGKAKPDSRDTKAPEAAESKLTLGAKIGESAAVPKQLGTTPPPEKPEAPAAPVASRGKGKLAPGITLKLVNRTLAAASVLLALGLVLELVAAKPGLPKPPGNVVPARVPGEIATPEEPGDAVGKRDIWDFGGGGGPTQQFTNEDDFVKVERYIQQNMTLDGVSLYPPEHRTRSFAVVTDRSEKGLGTRYWKINTGASVNVPGVDGPAEVILDEILENQVVFLYRGTRVLLSGRR